MTAADFWTGYALAYSNEFPAIDCEMAWIGFGFGERERTRELQKGWKFSQGMTWQEVKKAIKHNG